jgi:hypothetical protein
MFASGRRYPATTREAFAIGTSLPVVKNQAGLLAPLGVNVTASVPIRTAFVPRFFSQHPFSAEDIVQRVIIYLAHP